MEAPYPQPSLPPPSPVSYYHHVAINSVVYTDSGSENVAGTVHFWLEITRAMSLLEMHSASRMSSQNILPSTELCKNIPAKF